MLREIDIKARRIYYYDVLIAEVDLTPSVEERVKILESRNLPHLYLRLPNQAFEWKQGDVSGTWRARAPGAMLIVNILSVYCRCLMRVKDVDGIYRDAYTFNRATLRQGQDALVEEFSAFALGMIDFYRRYAEGE